MPGSFFIGRGSDEPAADEQTEPAEDQHKDVEVPARLAVGQQPKRRADDSDRQSDQVEPAEQGYQPHQRDDKGHKADEQGKDIKH